MRGLPCPHCYRTPNNLDMHLRFECEKLYGRSGYVAPEPTAPPVAETLLDKISDSFEQEYVESKLEKLFEDIEKFLDS